ncbi:TRAP transporter large permease [bacterium]|nr:TRAP transporter large permease [bacterium]
MSTIVIGLIGILILFVLLALRMQIGFSMALVGFVGFIILNDFESALGLIGAEPFDSSNAYLLSVIPLFILMGQFATHSGMGKDVYRMAYRWLGFLPGGLAMATVGACACFAAISGSSLATVATFGMVSLPEMKKFNYSDALATGCIAAGGTLGILIPPSTVLIIYGILTEQSISNLFIAGIIPGLLLSFLFIFTIYVMCVINPRLGAKGPSFTLREKLVSLKDTWSILTLFILVMGGLYTGWFTPTAAAGVGAFGALVIMIVKGRLSRQSTLASLKDSCKTTAMIFGIIIGATIFQYFMTISLLPDFLANLVIEMQVHRHVIMSLIIFLFIIMGCFMEGLSIMFLAVPIVFPIVEGMGYDPIWFGIIITLVMEMSLITPPVGVNVFVLNGVAEDVPMETIFKGVFPFWIAMLVCIILLMVFPDIVLFLPETMGYSAGSF